MSRATFRPHNHPESIHDRYISTCHIAYNTLNDRQKKIFKFAIRDVAEFRALIDECERQHRSRTPGSGHEALDSRRLQAALRRIIEDGRLPPLGPPLIEEDGPSDSASATAVGQAAAPQDLGVASSRSLSESSAGGGRTTHVARTAQARAPHTDRDTSTRRRRVEAILAQDKVLAAQARDPPSALSTRVSRATTSNRGESSEDGRPRRGGARGTACCRIS